MVDLSLGLDGTLCATYTTMTGDRHTITFEPHSAGPQLVHLLRTLHAPQGSTNPKTSGLTPQSAKLVLAEWKRLDGFGAGKIPQPNTPAAARYNARGDRQITLQDLLD